MSMSVIDERGRVFGRINLIDAAAAVFLFVLIPVAYGAYLLFRTPAARLTSIEPDTIQHGPNHRVQIHGLNLRPFMRVAFGTNQGVTFSISSTTTAEIEVPELPPGAYDVVLYDYRQEMDRLPKALKVLALSPVPQIRMEVAGSFKNLDQATASSIRAGQKLSPDERTAEVLTIGSLAPSVVRLKVGANVIAMPVPGQMQLPATIRVPCWTEVAADGSLRCMVEGPRGAVMIAPDSVLALAGPQGWLNFQVDSAALTLAPPMLDVQVALTVAPEVAALVKAGDVDAGELATSSTVKGTVASIVRSRERNGLDATFRVPAIQTSGGWIYSNQTLKAGLPFRFETAAYVLQGQIIAVKATPASSASR